MGDFISVFLSRRTYLGLRDFIFSVPLPQPAMPGI